MFGQLIFSGLDKMKAEASMQARDACEREDVPRDAPAHLRDEKPRFYKSKDGFRTTARLHINDVLAGDGSIVQYALVALSPALLACLALIAMVSPALAALLATACGMLAIAAGSLCSGRFFVAAFLGGTTAGAGLFFEFPISGAGAYLLLAWLYSLSTLFTSIELTAERERKLIEQGQRFAGASSPEKAFLYEAPAEARRLQVARAKQDTTPFLVLGASKGLFAATSQDGFAPDEGMPFGMTLADLKDNHLLVFGSTGTGKTSGVLKPIAAHWIRNAAGGALFADGKATLAQEMAELPGVKLLTPGITPFSLTQGMKAEEIAAVLAKHGSYQSSGADPFWSSQAGHLCTQAFLLLEFGAPLAPAYALTMKNGLRVINDPEYRASIIDSIEGSAMAVPPFLATAIHYFKTVVPAMEGPTRNGIFATAQSWINPLLQTRELLPWSDAAEGVDVTRVLQGEMLALDVSPAKYGPAATLVTQLVKARVYNALRQRGNAWKADPTQKPVLVMIDEAQELISEGADAEGTMLAIGRSLGSCFVLAMQDINSALGRFLASGGSREGCYAALSNCKSFITFASSHDTLNYVRQRLGKNMRRVATSKAEGIAYDALVKSVVESGGLRPRSALLRIAGRLTPSGFAGTVWGTILPKRGNEGNGQQLEDGSFVQQGSDGELVSALVVSASYEMKIENVLAEGEELILNTPLCAIGSLMNAGVPRRDAFQCNQIFAFTAEELKHAA